MTTWTIGYRTNDYMDKWLHGQLGTGQMTTWTNGYTYIVDKSQYHSVDNVLIN